MVVWHWWMQTTGAHGRLGWLFSVNGRWYGVTSSVGLAGLLAFWRHRNCHEPWCWRLGHIPDPSEPSFKRCPRHYKASKENP